MNTIHVGQEFYDTIHELSFEIVAIFPEKDYVQIQTESGEMQTYGLSDLHQALRDGVAVPYDGVAEESDDETSDQKDLSLNEEDE